MQYFVTVSQATAELYFHNGYDQRRFTIIPNAIDTAVIPAKKQPARLAAPVRFIFVGSVSPAKGITTLLKAAGYLGEDGQTGFQLDMYGDDTSPLAQEIIRQVRQSDLAQRVAFKGRIERGKLLRRYRDYDVALVPSLAAESFSLVAAEAMAAGVPVIASNIGGIPEVVVDGQTGFLVSPGSEQALAKQMQAFLNPETDYARLSAAALRHARQNFSLPVYLDRFENYLTDVLNNSRAREFV